MKTIATDPMVKDYVKTLDEDKKYHFLKSLDHYCEKTGLSTTLVIYGLNECEISPEEFYSLMGLMGRMPRTYADDDTEYQLSGQLYAYLSEGNFLSISIIRMYRTLELGAFILDTAMEQMHKAS